MEEGIERERQLLVDLLQLADLRVDTTSLSVHQLKETVVSQVAGRTRQTVVNLMSFGFRYGVPPSVELLFDLRFLPNPYFEEHLRERTGLDSGVAKYVLESERGIDLFERLRSFLCYLLPR